MRQERTNAAHDDVFDVIVVGAGWSGLIAAKTFLQVRPSANLLIIDSDSTIGGTWSKSRLYPNLRCEAGWGLFHFSDLNMDHEGIGRDDTIPGSAVYRYLDAYAAKFDLHRRTLLDTKAERIERVDQPIPWRLRILTSQTPRTLHCHKLIVATGLTSRPFIPDVPRDDFRGQIYHSKELGILATQEALTDDAVQDVTVYGGSKSAFEAVYYLVQLGKRVQWIIRPDGGGPSMMTPVKMLGFLPSFNLNNTRFFGVLSPNVFDRSSWWYRCFHGPHRLAIADWVVMTYWRVTTWMMCLSANYGRSCNGEKLKPHLGLESSFWSPATLGVMTCPNLWDYIHDAKLITVHRQSVQKLSSGHVELDNGVCLASDAFIFATGWQANHSIFDDVECEDLGLPRPPDTVSGKSSAFIQLRRSAEEKVVRDLPLLSHSPPGYEVQPGDDYQLYRFLVPTSEKYGDGSIAYIGFLRNTGLPIVLEAQALWATAYLLGLMELPGHDQRQWEAVQTSAWIRRRYLCGRKVPFALFDWFSYVDQLYADLGVVSRRKGNWFSETFAVYRPEEFRGVVQEWLAGHQPVM
ncbi:FAD-dependent monooxygenase DEP4 [Fulvia fulva]|uniref:FAD-dependent monooxygenase DEP4 n=1 Tax=Passalora fulva TaxID=5499 RepID=A0A9Q8PKB2_PASFU|nr:FAD-dependent monooxygenase DEP4 [Fulvia fulva]KAK4612329.1 FAD-dependent monooxygenase DEP4 [Fulvia fulva]KAK4612995.1 FAD-dependent monooxygenase DEP4 [Fulvia fulva]UJO24028.1 FAD-dependent monooxygenase DEP4 [Fulvia fulva]WPV21242.1 FAD-dependent monooxygenase DEP4 [Fulvia fulva]WPV35807.1 FAD-dependent monooxygenase DEP4 [Fulvia fulva]